MFKLQITYMKQSLYAFLKGIIDYAGLLPPADLSLDTSLHKYSDFRQSEDSWILSRFVIPAGRLGELQRYENSLLSQGVPFKFSVLGSRTATVDEFIQQVDKIVDEIDCFHQVHGERISTGILEIEIPEEALFSNDSSLLCEVFDQTAKVLDKSEHTPSYVFYEAVIEENWKKDIGHVLNTLSAHNKNKTSGYYRYAGFKLRCGGTKPEKIPSVEQVAFSMNNAREQNVAVKCSEGLQHPIRHFSDSLQARAHGFLNIFGGAMLSYAHDLNNEELVEILRDEDPDHFYFTEEAFHWQDLSVFTGEVTELREVALTSFGSCSLDELRKDLKRFGWI